MDEEMIKRITKAVGEKFRSFGGGNDALANHNPVAAALSEQPLQFALGENIEDVVRFILQEAKKQ